MKQSLVLKQSQKLTMMPQLQQAIRLLQMSTAELNEELQHAHETNPLLETKDENESVDSSDEADTDSLNGIDVDHAQAEPNHENLADESLIPLQFEQLVDPDKPLWDDPQNYAPVDQRLGDQRSSDYRRVSRNNDSDNVSMSQFVIPEEPSTLREELGAQAIHLFTDENDRRIAHHIIQNINEAGYIDVSLTDIEQTLNVPQSVYTDATVCMRDIERVLAVLQKLEPVGVAARNPKECLALQLQSKDTGLPGYQTATRIVNQHLSLLANKKFSKLRKLLGVSEQSLGVAVALIQQLNPHPGYSVGHVVVDYIVADVLLKKQGKHWYSSLNPHVLPQLTINQDYQKILNQHASGEFKSMREQLQHARWLINNLEKRHQTIQAVAQKIVEKQQDFFHFGAEKMQPLTLNDIAESLGIHESTVSRATAGKYLSTPQGIFELKHFFSSQIQTASGGVTSAVAIQAEIKHIIESESPTKPVSDETIRTLLAKNNYKVARRTVAKYREKINIPSSAKRRSL